MHQKALTANASSAPGATNPKRRKETQKGGATKRKKASKEPSSAFSTMTNDQWSDSNGTSPRGASVDAAMANNIATGSITGQSPLSAGLSHFQFASQYTPLIHDAASRIIMALTAQEQQRDRSGTGSEVSGETTEDSRLYEDTTRELGQLVQKIVSRAAENGNSMNDGGVSSPSTRNGISESDKEVLAQEIQELKLEMAEREDSEMALQHELQQVREELDEMTLNYNAQREENAKNAHFLNVLRGFHEDLLNSNKNMFHEVSDIVDVSNR